MAGEEKVAECEGRGGELGAADGTERGRWMNEEMLVPRPVRDSESEMAELVLPNDANPLGALLGGRLMHWPPG